MPRFRGEDKITRARFGAGKDSRAAREAKKPGRVVFEMRFREVRVGRFGGATARRGRGGLACVRVRDARERRGERRSGKRGRFRGARAEIGRRPRGGVLKVRCGAAREAALRAGDRKSVV